MFTSPLVGGAIVVMSAVVGGAIVVMSAVVGGAIVVMSAAVGGAIVVMSAVVGGAIVVMSAAVGGAIVVMSAVVGGLLWWWVLSSSCSFLAGNWNWSVESQSGCIANDTGQMVLPGLIPKTHSQFSNYLYC